jgi:hypothetical protein
VIEGLGGVPIEDDAQRQVASDRPRRAPPANRRTIGGIPFTRGPLAPSALIQGQPQSAGSVARVPAAKIESVVVDVVCQHIEHDGITRSAIVNQKLTAGRSPSYRVND